jgi:cytochrome c-type biogenesis protein CcmH/NrfG
LTARNNLAAAYREAGRVTEAIPLFERTVADCERLLGADHPRTLRARKSLARAREAAAHGPQD